MKVVKTLAMSPESAFDASDPIDEQIASLLESVSSKHEAQAAVMDSDFRPNRVAPSEGAATPLPKYPDVVNAPRALRRATVPRPIRPTEMVRQSLSHIAIDLPRLYLPLPRPYLSFYAMRQVFLLIAIGLLSVALGFLIVYLMSP